MKYAIIDLETTGLNPHQDAITEIACILVEDGLEIASCDMLVNPGRLIPAKVTEITGITNAMVYRAWSFPEVFNYLLKVVPLRDAEYVIGHNIIEFDYPFLEAAFQDYGAKAPLSAVVPKEKLRDTMIEVRADLLGLLQDAGEDYLDFSQRVLGHNVPRGSSTLKRSCEARGIPLDNMHRAIGDATATWHLWEWLTAGEVKVS